MFGQHIFHVLIVTRASVCFSRAGVLPTARGCPAPDTGDSIAIVTPVIYRSSACRVDCVTVNETLGLN